MAATKKREPDDWIMLDLDSTRPDPERAAAIARSVLLAGVWKNEELVFGEVVKVRSPGGKGWHVLLPVYRKYPHSEKFPWRLAFVWVILAQLLAGSDPGREKANFFRAQRGVKNWNRLFCTRRLPL